MYEYKINIRIQELRVHLNIKGDEFCRKTGIKLDALRSIENKKQKVNGEHLELICEAFPEFAYWIATGKTLPDAGQISPEIEAMKSRLKNGTA